MKDTRHELGQIGSRFRLLHPLGERPEHAPVIHLLEGLASGEGARNLADREHHRRRVLKGGVHADRGVARTEPPGHQADARLARELAVGLRHVGGAVLVAAGDEPDDVADFMERVEHRQIALAKDTESGIHAVEAQGVDDVTAAGSGLRLIRRRRLSSLPQPHIGSHIGPHIEAPLARP